MNPVPFDDHFLDKLAEFSFLIHTYCHNHPDFQFSSWDAICNDIEGARRAFSLIISPPSTSYSPTQLVIEHAKDLIAFSSSCTNESHGVPGPQ